LNIHEKDSSSMNFHLVSLFQFCGDFRVKLELFVPQLGRHSIFHQKLAEKDFDWQTCVLEAWTDSLAGGEWNVSVWMNFADVLWFEPLRFEVHRVIAPQSFVGVE
jgi:hypothetical protein